MSLGGFHGLMLQKKITQNDYKIVTIFHLFIYFLTQHAYVCVWFSIPCRQFCQDWKFFSVQVGCVFDKLGALQSGILW